MPCRVRKGSDCINLCTHTAATWDSKMLASASPNYILEHSPILHKLKRSAQTLDPWYRIVLCPVQCVYGMEAGVGNHDECTQLCKKGLQKMRNYCYKSYGKCFFLSILDTYMYGPLNMYLERVLANFFL